MSEHESARWRGVPFKKRGGRQYILKNLIHANPPPQKKETSIFRSGKETLQRKETRLIRTLKMITEVA